MTHPKANENVPGSRISCDIVSFFQAAIRPKLCVPVQCHVHMTVQCHVPVHVHVPVRH